MTKAHLLVPTDDGAVASLRYARPLLEDQGLDLETLHIDSYHLPRSDKAGQRLEADFKHTPQSLLRSWRTARQLASATRPGDIIVAADRSGLAGLFALQQLASPPAERRDVWSVAASSMFLEARLIGGVHSALPAGLESEIDWEIVQYRYSTRTLALSERARREVATLGAPAELLGSPNRSSSSPPAGTPRHVWVPDPVQRAAQPGEILRAATSAANVEIDLSTMDSPDAIWGGSTWEALSHVRDVLGDRVGRGDRPSRRPDLIVLGNPYAPPDRVTIALVEEGVPVVVPSGSVGAMLWPDAPHWGDVEDLAAIFKGEAPRPRNPVPAPSPERGRPATHRATRISVGIPVFRDVRFLDECLESIVSQDLQPFEILIIDDGSNSEDVDRSLERWMLRDDRIRVIRQQHRGVCVARNKAISEMTGDSFVFLDADDMLEPQFLSKCAEVMRADDRLWAVASWTRFFGDYEGIEAKPPFDERVGRRENPIISTSALVDMKVRDAGLAFAPDLAFIFCEDWHFWSQIVAVNGLVGLGPEALARHRVHPTSGGNLRTELAHAIGKARATGPLKDC